MVTNITVSVSNSPNAVYYAGQTVEAEVVFETDKQIPVEGVYAKFQGKAYTSWSTGSGDDRESHSETERYFKTEMSLMGNAVPGEQLVITPGSHSYTTSFILPPDIPSSFEDSTGHVRYLIKAKVVPKKGFFDYTVQHPFTVISTEDLNRIPESRMPVQMQDTKTACCWCCETGPVTCSVRLDRRGYVPGESILINAEITNNGNSSVLGTVATLKMRTTFKAHSSTTTNTKEISSISHGRFGPGESDIWTGNLLPVPSTPPSGLRGCSIIDPQYILQLTTKMEGSLMDIDFELPVIIGTIPLIMPPPPSLAGSGPFMSPTSIGTDNVMLQDMAVVGPITTQPGYHNEPPPSYEECTTTVGAKIMRQKSEEKGEEFMHFAPSYPYYNQKGT